MGFHEGLLAPADEEVQAACAGRCPEQGGLAARKRLSQLPSPGFVVTPWARRRRRRAHGAG